MELIGCSSEQDGGDSSDGTQSLLQLDTQAQPTQLAQLEFQFEPPDETLMCPRCQSLDTEFLYYNNLELTEARHFCHPCRRRWIVPADGVCRMSTKSRLTGTRLASQRKFNASSTVTQREEGNSSRVPQSEEGKSASPRTIPMAPMSDLPPGETMACPGCESTKLRRHNNHNLPQPRFFCPNCKRYWTTGGARQNGSMGGGSRTAKQPESNDLIPLTDYSFICRLISGCAGVALLPTFSSSPLSQSGEGNSSGDVPAFHVTQPSNSMGTFENGASSLEASPGITTLGYDQLQREQEVPVLCDDDLSAIFQCQSYTAAGAGGQAGDHGGIECNLFETLDNISNIIPVDVQWSPHQQVHQSSQEQAVCSGQEQEQGDREGRHLLYNVDENGLIESSREANGTLAMTALSSSGHEQSAGPEGSASCPSNVPAWQLQQVAGGFQMAEARTDGLAALWLTQSWAPLDMDAAMTWAPPKSPTQ